MHLVRAGPGKARASSRLPAASCGRCRCARPPARPAPQIGKTSALTMNIAGVVKDWLLIALSFLIYQ